MSNLDLLGLENNSLNWSMTHRERCKMAFGEYATPFLNYLKARLRMESALSVTLHTSIRLMALKTFYTRLDPVNRPQSH